MIISELYVLAKFKDGKFVEYVRKGRNNAISGYDNLAGAKRGYAHSLKAAKVNGYELRILHAGTMHFIDPKTGERVLQ